MSLSIFLLAIEATNFNAEKKCSVRNKYPCLGYVILCQISMASRSPGGYASPDDQGNLGLCTRFSLAKAVSNGFMDKDFVPGQELDFHQTTISTLLVNEHKVLSGKLLSTFLLVYFLFLGWRGEVANRV